jgi:hypothetical protein
VTYDPDEIGELIRTRGGDVSEPESDGLRPFDGTPRMNAGAASVENTPWIEDIRAADRHAQTHAKREKYPPHWVRCNFVRAGIRCCKGAGHERVPNLKIAAHEEPA